MEDSGFHYDPNLMCLNSGMRNQVMQSKQSKEGTMTTDRDNKEDGGTAMGPETTDAIGILDHNYTATEPD